MATAVLISGCLILVAWSTFLRLLPSLRGVRGVDAWYYLLHAGALRQSRSLPARLPAYLLAEEEQRYPPVFPLLLAALPPRLLEGWQSWIAVALDALHLFLLLAVARGSGLHTEATLLAGLVYATTPDLAHEYGTLSSRAWASLVVTLVALSAPHAQEPVFFTGAAALVALLLLSHKLATQFLVTLLLVLSIQMGSPAPALTGAVGLGLAYTTGLYAGVFRAHLAVLRYWRKNVSLRGAHPVYDSPLYSTHVPLSWHRYRLYAPGWGGAWRLLRGLLARNPWVLLALPTALVAGHGPLVAWLFAVYLMAAATLFVPPLRFLGEGFRYLKFGAFPVALLVGQAYASKEGIPVVMMATGLSLYVIYRLQSLRPLEVMDLELAAALAFLRRDARPRVAALPTHHADGIAWHAKKQVLWGGHSSGYERLADLVPVLRRPFTEQLAEHRIELLLLDRRYVRPEVLGLGAAWQIAWTGGPYLIYECRTGS